MDLHWLGSNLGRVPQNEVLGLEGPTGLPARVGLVTVKWDGGQRPPHSSLLRPHLLTLTGKECGLQARNPDVHPLPQAPLLPPLQ